MKKIIAILAVLMVAYFGLLARADETAKKSVEDILTDLRQSQKVQQTRDINCEKVSNEQFEELGDAVMGIMHPDENEHELMDQMMGGEGSSSLEAMHISMGRKYLGCWNQSLGGYGGMMSEGGMMGNFGNISGFGMMGGYAPWGSGWIVSLLFWIALIFMLIFFAKWFFEKKKEDVRTRSAMDILKERYAKGDIEKKVFEEMKKDLE